MNNFSNKFDNRIRSYWSGGVEPEKQRLLEDILQYANSNSHTFKREIDEIRFDRDLLPLPLVIEALSKDTASWGQFYVDILDDIFIKAKQVEKPKEILTNLMEFAFVEDDDKPFIQKIADRLYKEISSENLDIKLAAIWTLICFMNNKAIRNKSGMIVSLQQLLSDGNWKVRVLTFEALGYENLLPPGHKLSFKDKLFKLILGESKII